MMGYSPGQAAQMLSGSGCFVIKPGVNDMKQYNLRAAVATRAAQIATGAVKQKFRSGGGRNVDFRISDHRTAIDELSRREEIIAKATKDIERWRSNLNSDAQRKRR